MDEKFKKNREGRYETKNLSPKEFISLFNRIKKEDQRKRRLFSRKNILTPYILRNKSLDDILGLGKKKGGVYYTREDLIDFEKQRNRTRQRFDYKTAGIPYNQLISASRKIDVDRANNKVTDGRGITSANLLGFKKNVVYISVKASQISADDNHMVELRLEEWEQALENISDDRSLNRKIAKSLAAGRMSIQCDCGRFKYWYRYIATVGNFVVAPPKEFAFPKEKNSKGYGVACKHIIHAATRLQSPAWHNFIVNALKTQSKSNAYGDDKRTTTYLLSEKEQKTANRNRKSQTDLKEARVNYTRYKKRMAELEKKQNQPETQKLLEQLKSAKKKSSRQQADLKKIREKNKLIEAKLKQEERLRKDELTLRKRNFIDTLRFTGMSKSQAEKAWEDFIKRGG